MSLNPLTDLALTLDQITNGLEVCVLHAHLLGGSPHFITVRSTPYEGRIGELWVDCDEELSPGDVYHDKAALSDMGVIPYSSGLWNGTNFTVRKEQADEGIDEAARLYSQLEDTPFVEGR